MTVTTLTPEDLNTLDKLLKKYNSSENSVFMRKLRKGGY